MSKTKAELEEEIELLRRRSVSALEAEEYKAEEYKAEAIRLDKILSEHGIPHPDCLMSQIEHIEKQYREEIMELAALCEKQTGRPLFVAFLNL